MVEANSFAAFLMTPLFLALARLRAKGGAGWSLWLGAVGALVFAIVLTYSRSGFVTMVATGVLYAARSRIRAKHVGAVTDQVFREHVDRLLAEGT